MFTKKTIGVIGGMGPLASANFYLDLLLEFQQNHGAVEDADYPHIIIDSLPLESFTVKGEGDPTEIIPKLNESIDRLTGAGSDFLVMACNTLHHYYDQLAQHATIPFLSIIDATMQEVLVTGKKHIGIISTAESKRTNLYREPLQKHGLTFYETSNTQQQLVDGLLAEIMRGTLTSEHQTQFTRLIEDMLEEGAELVVLACTELPLIIDPRKSTLPLISSSAALAKLAARYSQNQGK